ncbi:MULTISPECIES: hypothetical protein [Pseudomonas aeruginosa group]|uniref:hypothetical protein n=1 Tax=Pseudomonas aeruginosa group TaxID=136841 RepID=UPI00129875B9|nr:MULTISPECIES: hypothetical protein [Pseudomonas aeruginosa group]MDK2349915.1 hypothetical protein [Pseudomonas paraeruginosa]MEA8483650.1 hypothetical protein [Pseudomonas aeruginosa]
MSRVNPPPSATMRTTAKDRAVCLGMVTSNIKRTFDEHSRISPELRWQILAIPDELGCWPNAVAHSLSRGKTGVIPQMIFSQDIPFCRALLDDFALRLRQSGRRLLMFVAPPGGDADESMPKLLQYQVDTIVVTAAKLTSRMSEHCEQRHRCDIPQPAGGGAACLVCLLQQSAHRSRSHHLRGRAVIAEPAQSSPANLDSPSLPTACTGSSRASRSTVTGSWPAIRALRVRRAKANRRPSLQQSRTRHRRGALRQRRDVHRRTSPLSPEHFPAGPEDMALIGFYDIRDTSYPEHSLTALRQPLDQMIDCAVELIDACPTNGSHTDAVRWFCALAPEA